MLRCFLLILIWAPLAAQAQSKLNTSAGFISFRSDAPLEDIDASSSKLKATLLVPDRRLAFVVPMQSFVGFNSGLQRQHFNENYVESEKFPNATFSGRIIEEVDLTRDGDYTVRAKGKLTVHGVAQERIIKGQVRVRGGQVSIACAFQVPLAEHDITIPRIVYRKIAEVIDVKLQVLLKP